MAFPVPIFTELPKVQQHCFQIPYTEFHPKQMINVERKDLC